MTIFSKIIEGEIPSFKIYEDDLTFAFLDINPHNLGHTLIVPKIEIGKFEDLPEKYVIAISLNTQKIAKAIHKATGAKRVGMMIHGMGVPDHFHLHICPMHTPFDLDQNKAHQENEEKMIQIQQIIVSNLK